MARVVGSIASETLLTIPIKKSYVMSTRKRRFVFMAHVQPQVYDIAKNQLGSRKMYDNFMRAVRNKLYNTAVIYGLDAVDIDRPQDVLVSVRLKFTIVDDTSDASCTMKKIKKPED